MEVGKLIVNVVGQKAHMTLSVKPFGCMPSSGVSDGVQSLISSRFPGTIFCAVETSGDGATNFYSRVQMYMFKARLAAEDEYRETLAACGVTEEQVRAFLAKNPRYASALHKAPHRVNGSTADLVYEVAPFITQTRAQRAMGSLRRGLAGAREAAATVPVAARKAVESVRSEGFRAQVRADAELVTDLVRGRVKERYGPLVERLAARAMFDEDPLPTTAAGQPVAQA